MFSGSFRRTGILITIAVLALVVGASYAFAASCPTGVSGGNYDASQCTCLVQLRRMQHGDPMPWFSGDAGNAKNWADTARAQGYAVGTVPALYSVLVLQPGAEYADQTNGHVAFVTQVNDDGSFLVDDRDWGSSDRHNAANFYTDPALNKDGEPNTQFIYFPGILPRWWQVGGLPGVSLPETSYHWSGSSWDVVEPGSNLTPGYGYFVYAASSPEMHFSGAGSEFINFYPAPQTWSQVADPCSQGPGYITGGDISWIWDNGTESYTLSRTVNPGQSAFVWSSSGPTQITVAAPACATSQSPPPNQLPPPTTNFTASITTDNTEYGVGDPITVCYHLDPANVPFSADIIDRAGTNEVSDTGSFSDNGVGGGDCLQGTVDGPQGTHELDLTVQVNGQTVTASTTFWVYASYVPQ